MDELQAFQKLVINNAKHARGLLVGDNAPDFILPNALGNNITLARYLKEGPVILKFYRGEWCPLCNLDLRQIQEIYPRIVDKGASVFAISPQRPDNAMIMKEKNELVFEVLSDADQKVIKQYGLQFDPGLDYHQRRDLSTLNGDGSLFLPIPATFIIDRDFVIRGAHVEANYTERLEPDQILKVLDTIS